MKTRPWQGSKRESGYTMLAVMVAIAIVSVALVNQGLVAGYGALAVRSARHMFACRQAALAIINRTPPSQQGGAIDPQAAVTGWSDRVYVNPESGEIFEAGGDLPDRAIVVARQWRRGPDGAGKAVYEVSSIAVDGDGRPLEGGMSARVVLSRRIR